jgi:hypothetical protein
MSQFTLYVQYTVTYSGGEVCEGQENDSWPSYEDAYEEHHFECIRRSLPKDKLWKSQFEYMKVDHKLYVADTLYLATIEYADGGTFGRTLGYRHFVGLYATRTEAEEAINNAKNENGYMPWTGYFASHIDDHIDALKVED